MQVDSSTSQCCISASSSGYGNFPCLCCFFYFCHKYHLLNAAPSHLFCFFTVSFKLNYQPCSVLYCNLLFVAHISFTLFSINFSLSPIIPPTFPFSAFIVIVQGPPCRMRVHDSSILTSSPRSSDGAVSCHDSPDTKLTSFSPEDHVRSMGLTDNHVGLQNEDEICSFLPMYVRACTTIP